MNHGRLGAVGGLCPFVVRVSVWRQDCGMTCCSTCQRDEILPDSCSNQEEELDGTVFLKMLQHGFFAKSVLGKDFTKKTTLVQLLASRRSALCYCTNA